MDAPTGHRHRPHGPIADDYTIDQAWERYSAAEHARWDLLHARQVRTLRHRACPEFLQALDRLALSDGGIPHFGRLSDRLAARTGWQVVAVPDLVPDAVFFEHLANRRFPAGAFIRGADQLDYLQEPDVFHDVFGHVPMLADPVFADFMQAYGAAGLAAVRDGRIDRLARLYWYTVEFGLVRGPRGDGLRIFGAGILSSARESVYALEDPGPRRIGFRPDRVMRTRYRIDDLQQVYFVIDDFDQLLDSLQGDLEPLYARAAAGPDLSPEAVETDDALHILHPQAAE